MKSKSVSQSPSFNTPRDQLKLLSEATSSIASELNLQETLYAIVNQIFEYFQPRGASIMVVDGDNIRVVAGRSLSQNPQSRPKDLPSFKIGDGAAGRAVVTGKPEWIEDTQSDAKFHRIPGKVSKIRALLAVPMLVQGRVMGVLNVSYSEPHHFTEDEITTLQVIAIPAGYAIQNASLFERISEERQKLELVQNSIRDGLTVCRTDGTLTFSNTAAKEMFGDTCPLEVASRGKHRTKNFQIDFTLPQVLAEVNRGRVFRTLVVVGSNGSRRYIQANFSALRSPAGLVGILGNHHDQTEIFKQAQEIRNRLVEEETERERFQAIFDNVEEAIVVTDASGVIRQINPATTILTGQDEKALLGADFSTIFPLENARGVKLTGDLAPGRTAISTKESIEYLEARFVNSEGREIWLGLSVTPVRVNDEIAGNDQVVFVMRDITKLKEIDQAKSDFVSMASHELRTPLTIINGYIDLFMSGDLGDINRPELSHYKQVFSQIQRSTDRLNALVEDLLNVSRIEQGRLNLSLERMNLSLLTQDVIEEMRSRAGAKNHQIRYVPPRTTFLELPLLVRADHDKVKQVLINLLDNAIKYTKEGGVIEVEIKRDRHEAIVSVRDNGIGIPKAMLPRVFEKFQRASGTYVKDNLGTGLGLYIVREILRAHGGRVWVESMMGKGSTFSFSLPIYQEVE